MTDPTTPGPEAMPLQEDAEELGGWDQSGASEAGRRAKQLAVSYLECPHEVLGSQYRIWYMASNFWFVWSLTYFQLLRENATCLNQAPRSAERPDHNGIAKGTVHCREGR